MLDMGFILDIERICKILPITRQTLFFSATMPPEIQRLTNQFLHNPVEVQAAPPATTAASIIQKAVYAPSDDKEKRDALRRLLREYDNIKNAIVFANRDHGGPRNLAQEARLQCLGTSWRHGSVLAAEDARGVPQRPDHLSDRLRRGGAQPRHPSGLHVFNFDVPVHSEDYVHRVGRTGRAGREGHAYTLVTEEVRALRAIEQLIKRPVEWHGEVPAEDELADAMSAKGRRRDRPQRGAARSGAGPARKHAREKPAPRPSHDAREKRSEEQQHPRPLKKAPRPERPREREDARERDPAGFTEANMPAFLLAVPSGSDRRGAAGSRKSNATTYGLMPNASSSRSGSAAPAGFVLIGTDRRMMLRPTFIRAHQRARSTIEELAATVIGHSTSP